jgi:hypothetical protein
MYIVPLQAANSVAVAQLPNEDDLHLVAWCCCLWSLESMLQITVRSIVLPECLQCCAGNIHLMLWSWKLRGCCSEFSPTEQLQLRYHTPVSNMLLVQLFTCNLASHMACYPGKVELVHKG